MAIYRGAKCLRLKTAGKQPKKVLSGSRQTAGKTAETPEKHLKQLFLCFSRMFRLFFQRFFGLFDGTHSAPFSAVFRLFSVSGIWHLCRWRQRLQIKSLGSSLYVKIKIAICCEFVCNRSCEMRLQTGDFAVLTLPPVSKVAPSTG